jgi:hypothetical protein
MEQECVYTVTVNYDLSLEEMIAAGRYDWKHYDITAERFPLQGEGQVEVEITLVHIGRDMSTDNVLKELDARGLRSAKIEELLALGADQPELQRKFPIIALGSVWCGLGGGRNVVDIATDYAGRCLRVRWYESDWAGIYRFVTVRKTV